MKKRIRINKNNLLNENEISDNENTKIKNKIRKQEDLKNINEQDIKTFNIIENDINNIIENDINNINENDINNINENDINNINENDINNINENDINNIIKNDINNIIENDINNVIENNINENNINKNNNEYNINENNNNKNIINDYNIMELKQELKYILMKNLTIALDMNMYYIINNVYFLKYVKIKKIKNYILKISNFIIILGKYLHLSNCVISLALYYIHRYYEQNFKKIKKKKKINYFLASASIFLAWKIRDDYENIKKSKKLIDIPKCIFKILNYFYKKKNLKEKINQIEIYLIENFDYIKSKLKEEFVSLSFNSKENSSIIYKLLKVTKILDEQDDIKINIRNDKINNNENIQINNNEHIKINNNENIIINNNENIIINNNENIKINNNENINKDINFPKTNKRITSLDNINELNEKRINKYDNIFFSEINKIIQSDDIKDFKMFNNIEKNFYSYLSEFNSDDISEYEDDYYKKTEKKNEKNEKNEKNKNELYIKKKFIYEFKKACKNKKKEIYVSSSKWILNDKGEKLLEIKKMIIYYEGEILKNIKYGIKPDKSAMDVYPLIFKIFYDIYKNILNNTNIINYLQKISYLIILDIYKTPLCLFFSSSEIVIVSLIKSFLVLNEINKNVNLNVNDLFQDFEKNINKFLDAINNEYNLSINRLKILFKNMRLVS